jgi:hypothetical protein
MRCWVVTVAATAPDAPANVAMTLSPGPRERAGSIHAVAGANPARSTASAEEGPEATGVQQDARAHDRVRMHDLVCLAPASGKCRACDRATPPRRR